MLYIDSERIVVPTGLYQSYKKELIYHTIAEDGSIQSSLINTYEKKVTGLNYTGEWFFYMIETEEDSEYEIWKRDVATGEEKSSSVSDSLHELKTGRTILGEMDGRSVVDGWPNWSAL